MYLSTFVRVNINNHFKFIYFFKCADRKKMMTFKFSIYIHLFYDDCNKILIQPVYCEIFII